MRPVEKHESVLCMRRSRGLICIFELAKLFQGNIVYVISDKVLVDTTKVSKDRQPLHFFTEQLGASERDASKPLFYVTAAFQTVNRMPS